MAVILDTNALSAFAEGDEKLLRVLVNETELALPVIALGEYLYGIQQSRLRAAYETWLQANLSFFDLLPIVRDIHETLIQVVQSSRVRSYPSSFARESATETTRSLKDSVG